MDIWVYLILFICGLALYAFAYRQGQKDERRVVQAWLDNIVVTHEGEWQALSGRKSSNEKRSTSQDTRVSATLEPSDSRGLTRREMPGGESGVPALRPESAKRKAA
jgi:hypothetical protein